MRYITATLGALAVEEATGKCPPAKGSAYSSPPIAALPPSARELAVLPHLARLSKLFPREIVTFLAAKEQVTLITQISCRVLISCLFLNKNSHNRSL